jgi:hypothetical protein
MKSRSDLLSRTTLFLVSDWSDLNLLRLCLISILANVPKFYKIIIVIPKAASEFFQLFINRGVVIIYRENFDEDKYSSFINHQIIKLTVPSQIANSEFIWYIDSDYLFYRKIKDSDLWIRGNPLHYFSEWDIKNSFWKNDSEKILGISFDFAQMIYPPYLIRFLDLINLNKRYNLKDLIHNSSNFSEFELLFNFVFRENSSHYVWKRFSDKNLFFKSGFLLHQSPPDYFNLNKKFSLLSVIKHKYVVIWSHWHRAEAFVRQILLISLLSHLKISLLKMCLKLEKIPIVISGGVGESKPLVQYGIVHEDSVLKRDCDLLVQTKNCNLVELSGNNLRSDVVKVTSSQDIRVLLNGDKITIANDNLLDTFKISFTILKYLNTDISGRKVSCQLHEISFKQGIN